MEKFSARKIFTPNITDFIDEFVWRKGLFKHVASESTEQVIGYFMISVTMNLQKNYMHIAFEYKYMHL